MGSQSGTCFSDMCHMFSWVSYVAWVTGSLLLLLFCYYYLLLSFYADYLVLLYSDYSTTILLLFCYYSLLLSFYADYLLLLYSDYSADILAILLLFFTIEHLCWLLATTVFRLFCYNSLLLSFYVCWLLATTVFWLFCYYSATILLLFFIIELLCWLLATTVLWLIDYSATIHTSILLLLFTIELLCWLFCYYSAYFANILTTLLLWQYRKGSHPMSLTMSLKEERGAIPLVLKNQSWSRQNEILVIIQINLN